MNPTKRSVQQKTPKLPHIIFRIRLVYGFLLFFCALVILRLFQLQVIQHNYYQIAANKSQIKQFALPAQRGIIEAYSGNTVTPLVLNQTTYVLFADPADFKTDAGRLYAATNIQKIIGGDAANYLNLINTKNTEYVVLNESISQSQNDAINNLNIYGINTSPEQKRVYPNGTLAAQVLGYVNTNGQGQNGIEQYYNSLLGGTQGSVKGITDAQGNLLYNQSNIIKQPTNGNNIILTLNIPIQEQVEQALASVVTSTKAASGTVIVMNPNNGDIVSMADYPSYDPGAYQNYANNQSIYQNAAVSSLVEPGSIMKTFTTAAALNQGVITPTSSFFDPAQWTIDGSTIKDVAIDGGPQNRNIASILVDSLNTGAVWMLMQMGGGQVNQQARDIWYNYLVNKFNFGNTTGIQQPNESSFPVPSPDIGSALDLNYANTSFGQGIDITPIEFISAESAILNGGTFYKPNLVKAIVNSTTNQTTYIKPKILKTNIIKPIVSQQLQGLMEQVVSTNYAVDKMTAPRTGYITGGKTGTAQVAINGKYSNTDFTGTYIGFIGINKPDYVIFIQVNNPQLPSYEYAGTVDGAFLFGKITDILANGGYVN